MAAPRVAYELLSVLTANLAWEGPWVIDVHRGVVATLFALTWKRGRARLRLHPDLVSRGYRQPTCLSVTAPGSRSTSVNWHVERDCTHRCAIRVDSKWEKTELDLLG